MNASIRKQFALFALLSISGASFAAESAIAVNTDGMPAFLAAKVEAKAQQGANELRRFVWRTRMVYGLDLKSIVRG